MQTHGELIERKENPMPPSELRCRECNSAIAADSTTCRKCHAPIVRRYCPGCSKLVPDNTEACPYCGVAATAPVRNVRGVSANIAVVGTLIALCLLLVANYAKTPHLRQVAMQQEPTVIPLPKAGAAVKSNTVGTVPAQATQRTAANVQPDENEGIRLNTEAHDLMTQGQFEEAIPLLKKAVITFPQGTSTAKYALYNLGNSLRRTGHAQEAIPYLQQCVLLDSQWGLAQGELAKAQNQISGQSGSPSPQTNQATPQ